MKFIAWGAGGFFWGDLGRGWGLRVWIWCAGPWGGGIHCLFRAAEARSLAGRQKSPTYLRRLGLVSWGGASLFRGFLGSREIRNNLFWQSCERLPFCGFFLVQWEKGYIEQAHTGRPDHEMSSLFAVNWNHFGKNRHVHPAAAETRHDLRIASQVSNLRAFLETTGERKDQAQRPGTPWIRSGNLFAFVPKSASQVSGSVTQVSLGLLARASGETLTLFGFPRKRERDVQISTGPDSEALAEQKHRPGQAGLGSGDEASSLAFCKHKHHHV